MSLGLLIWAFGLYSVVLSKYVVPVTGIGFLDFIKEDRYYSYVGVPYLMIMLIIAYFNWVSMKYFRHA